MGPGSATQLCPRCGVAQPASARFCRHCGLTLTASMDAVSPPPSSPTYTPAYMPPAADPAANRWSAQGASQATYQPAHNPAYANPPVGNYASYNVPVDDYPAYDDEPEKPRRSFWRSLWGVVVIGFLLVLVLGVSAFGIFFYPSLCSVGERNGLRDDIPLPCGLTYKNHLDRSNSTSGAGAQEWVYTVDSMTPDQIKSFYQSGLPDPNRGWTLSATADASSQANNGLIACKGPTAVQIYGSQQPVQEGDFTFSPPPQGSLLVIIVIPVKNLPPTTCPGS